jgi:4-hydroxybenzoate polyprenyltransferase
LTTAQQTIADAKQGNWVDTYAPLSWRPYLRLARLDRPIGAWLLFWPCAWGAAWAGSPWPDPRHLALFALGAFAMRGAGCTLNDIVDRDIDAKVARTALRPLASGAVTLRGAALFLMLQCLMGALVLFQFNTYTIVLGIASLLPVAIYPFMKRITWWPQLFLGIAFNWGALVGIAAVDGELSIQAFMLYGAGILWTIGYDTIYAHQDKEDDALIGVKSTARLFDQQTRPALAILYGATIIVLGTLGAHGAVGPAYWFGLCAVAAQLTWQIVAFRHENAALCLFIFKSNHLTGALIFLTLILGRISF